MEHYLLKVIVEYGGVTGYQNSTNAITNNCYNLKKITGKSSVGGIIGGNAKGTISNCFTIGEVEGKTTYFHSIMGSGQDNADTTVTNCYYLNSLSVTDTVGTAKSDADMKAQAFVDALNASQADAPWKMDENINQGYPIFKWQK